MNKTISFISSVQDDIRDVETLMRAQADGYHPDLQSALELLVSSGGKRIRPALTLLAGRMLGGKREDTVIIGAAIELLHTATLVHDDLIDGSLLRRGIPTLNSTWSPGATVLTGDFLFARAAKLSADTNSIPVMKLFANTLTIIVDGEITQLFSSRCRASREDYYKRIYSKTASLFETSAASAALVSPVEPVVVEEMRRFGYEIGMAFQIIDDILDFTGEQATLGKPIGNDLRQGIITLPAIYYIERNPAHPAAKKLLNGECIREDGQTQTLIDAIRSSEAIKLAHREASDFVERGLQSLLKLPPCPERDLLQEMGEYIVNRDF